MDQKYAGLEDKKNKIEESLNKKIFEVVEKPEGFLFVKSHNVYDDKYRVNIYSNHVVDEALNIQTKRISHSYFCKYDGENVKIISS